MLPIWDPDKEARMFPPYLEGIKAAGGSPLVFPETTHKETLKRYIERADGIVFTGGYDISPALYGMKDETGGLVEPFPKRDEMESFVLEETLRADKPILGVCRGLQFINAALGGTLYQDLPTQHSSGIKHQQEEPFEEPVHDIMPEGPLKELAGKNTLKVNSLHHQAVRTLSPELEPMATSPDGLIEAAYMPSRPFVWAVQWHPEFLFRNSPVNLAILQAFIDASL